MSHSKHIKNHFFHFRQFSIHQEHTAMKVSTDACIQGAVFAFFLVAQARKVTSVLDIGAGTGLLSLMIAQQNPEARIMALELEAQAARDCAANFRNSRWSERLQAIHTDALKYTPGHTFEAIICNPPFFEKHLLSEKEARIRARHDSSLDKNQLLQLVQTLLDQEGHFCIMYPRSEWERWSSVCASSGLQPVTLIAVRPRPEKAVNRMIGIYSLQQTEQVVSREITIYKNTGIYTSEFSSLMQRYYLNL